MLSKVGNKLETQLDQNYEHSNLQTRTDEIGPLAVLHVLTNQELVMFQFGQWELGARYALPYVFCEKGDRLSYGLSKQTYLTLIQ